MKISLITISFNSGRTIEDTIRSVSSQTYKNVEYIIIDGKSTDNTIDVIDKYKHEFQNLKLVSEKDNGLYDALNKGIVMATGDIIGILNSDDFFTSNHILATVAQSFSEETDIDAIYGDVHYVNGDDLNKCVRYYSSKPFKRNLMRGGFMPAHPSFFVKRACYEKFGIYKTDYTICGDFELLLRFIYVNNIVTRYLPIDMVTMRMGGVSTSGISSHITITKEHLRALRTNKIHASFCLIAYRYAYKLTEFFKK